MSTQSQSFANHGRIPPLAYNIFFVVLIVEFGVRGYHLVTSPSLTTAWAVVVAFAVMGILYYARVNAQVVQDRVIMFEMRTRLAGILPAAQHAEIQKLSKAQLVGLRFASDEELPALVQATLAESLTNKAIKQRVKNWQADWQRV